MNMKWITYKLGEIVEVYGGGTPSTKNDQYWNGNIPWLTPKEVTAASSRFISKTEKYISEDGLKKSSAKLMPSGTILMTSRATIGEVVVNKVPMATNQGFINIVCKNIDKFYLFYWLKLNKGLLILNSHGTTFNELIKSVFKEIEINLPSLATQCKIASILSAYDDLIENNTQRIKILEEMAQAIYKEWFVNFRFPGHEKVKMIGSELRQIPEGWEVKSVGSTVKRLKAGNTYTQKTVLPFGNVPVVDQSRDECLGFHNNEPTHYASSTNPIIIFGDHTCKMQIMVEPFSLGPNVIPLVSFNNDKSNIYFLFFTIRSLVETQEYKRHWNELIVKRVVIPEKRIQIVFSDTVRPMIAAGDLLRKKNLNLRRTCDHLLAKLISGEIDVEGDGHR